MSKEFERIRKERREITNQLDMLEVEEQTLRGRITETPTLICDNCENIKWHVQVDYDPWNMRAYESRNIVLTCQECGEVLMIPVQSEY